MEDLERHQARRDGSPTLRSPGNKKKQTPRALVVCGASILSVCLSFLLVTLWTITTGSYCGLLTSSNYYGGSNSVFDDSPPSTSAHHSSKVSSIQEEKDPASPHQKGSRLEWPELVSQRVEPGILFVNMPEHPGRLSHLEGLLRDIGFHGIRFESACPECNFWRGTMFSHQRFLQRVASEGHDRYVIILEDDVELAHDLDRKDFLATLEDSLQNELLPYDGFVYLGVCLDQKQWKACTPRQCAAFCTHAYMVTPEGARQVLKMLRERYGEYDKDKHQGNVMDGMLCGMFQPPVLGFNFTHDHTSPQWRGLFYQARKAPWYNEERRNNETRPGG